MYVWSLNIFKHWNIAFTTSCLNSKSMQANCGWIFQIWAPILEKYADLCNIYQTWMVSRGHRVAVCVSGGWWRPWSPGCGSCLTALSCCRNRLAGYTSGKRNQGGYHLQFFTKHMEPFDSTCCRPFWEFTFRNEGWQCHVHVKRERDKGQNWCTNGQINLGIQTNLYVEVSTHMINIWLIYGYPN